ncbi:MAG: TrkH family potassium uptake protein [Saprospiraceae bacterium]|nr:TrkH family potassium uptake protein [Saprospiraceae bacterium]MCB9320740.1 TrkH family potassium uptake protein [Lewinellaceae bacterium]
MIQFMSIARVLGVLLIIFGMMMATSIGFSLYFQSGDIIPLLQASGITIGSGLLMFFIGLQRKVHIGKREGYLIVALGWIFMTLFGMLPFIISGVIPHTTNAFFETISGLTTTGASILDDIEAVPKGILFWRSLTQWIGGMGIIVLTVALLPLLGIGGIELFVAEVPGPTSDKIHPRIVETARSLWLVYVILTGACTGLLMVAGMTFYDALNHAFTTMATGGFSTKNASIAYYTSPYIQYILVFFMFLAGTNYNLLYFGIRGKLKTMWRSDEFKVYTIFIVGVSIILTGFVLFIVNEPAEKIFRDVLFQVVSIITTTGFVTADYTQWSVALTMFFFILMFLGGSAGSTSGGIKFIRHIVFLKNSFLEFKRLLHPRALIRVKIDHQIVVPRVLTHILVFLLIYLLVFLSGSVVVAFLGMDFISAIGAVATCLANVGPGIGTVGPVNNFAAVPDAAKWFLSFLMLLGRLELFTILLLFTPYFWKSN